MTNPAYVSSKDNLLGVSGPEGPARMAETITPSDTVAVSIGPADLYAKALYVGTSGDLVVITASDTTNAGLGTPVTFKTVPVGWFPVQVRAVLATGTTADDIVGLAD